MNKSSTGFPVRQVNPTPGDWKGGVGGNPSSEVSPGTFRGFDRYF